LRSILLLSLAGYTAVAVISSAQSQPGWSQKCKYNPDTQPTQIGPGSHPDGAYRFEYVSDYESATHTFRLRICNDSNLSQRVKFDWKLTVLKGKCPSGESISAEDPHSSSPKTDTGPLIYDLRSTPVQSYVFDPQAEPSATFRKLVSKVAGFVEPKKGQLERVSLEVNSSWEKSRFQYEISNQSQQVVVVKMPRFSEFWSGTRPAEYRGQVATMIKQGVLATSDFPTDLTVNAGQRSVWSFTFEGTPEVIYSPVEIRASGSNDVDLGSVVALYVPRK
jgi:hypothetical protein